MEWYKKFKRLLGFPGRQESLIIEEQDRYWQPHRKDEEIETPCFQTPGRSFNIFTDPLEIHKYFEQQMIVMLRNFGFRESDDDLNDQFKIFPEIEDFTYPRVHEVPEDGQTGDLRDQFLKPGYRKLENAKDEKIDSDIDGKLDITDWGSVFQGERQIVPKSQFYGKSVSVKTVKRPDGMIETHQTVKDNEGNVETTIVRKIEDKEYTIIKRIDKDGKQETFENLVNLNEEEVNKFFHKEMVEPNKSWLFFDRLFK